MMATQTTTALKVARAHIDAWSHHDWQRTRELLAPDVHAWVTSTQPDFGTAELAGVDACLGEMARKFNPDGVPTAKGGRRR
jgi:ketosteroid isomerase-like protein